MSIQDPPVEGIAQKSPAKPGVVLFFLCIAGFMTFLDVSIVNVALPTIEDELHIEQSHLQYIVTAYGMVLGGFLLFCGRLADYFGRRRALQVGLVVFAIASLLAGFAQDALMLIVARGSQGLGAAFIATSALSLITNNFAEGAERNKALGAWGALSGIAAVAGVIAGGLLTDGPGWRWIFYINVPIGIVCAIVAPMIVAESRSQERRRGFDALGALVLTSGLLLLIYSLGQTVDDTGTAWTSPPVLGGIAGAVILLIGFVLIERKVRAPLIPLGIFRIRGLRAANIIAVLLFGTMITLFFFASLFMQQVLDYSAVQTGLAYVPIAVCTGIGAGVASKLVTKVAAKPVLLVGLAMAGIGMTLLWRLPADGSYVVDVLPAFVIGGLGLGMSFVPTQIAAFTGVESSEHGGVAAGLINTSQEAGGALGLAVVASIAFSRIPELTAWADGDPERVLIARETVFHQAFLVGAGFAAAAFLVTLVMLPMLRTSDHDGVPAPA